MNYTEISKETMGYLYKGYESLETSPLDQTLRACVELRVSQINGCVYCCNLHTKELEKKGVAPNKIEALPQWSSSSLFTDKEKAALAWGEALTTLSPDLESIKSDLPPLFSDREIVDLTVCIGLMNAFNRLSRSFGE